MDAPPRCRLSAAEQERCEQIACAFDAAWQGGPAQPPDLQAFLPAEEPLRGAVLRALAPIDLELRLGAGQAGRVEDYLERFGELISDRDAVLTLLAVEYDQRHHRRENVSFEEYRRRFPLYAADLPARLPPPPLLSTPDVPPEVRERRPWPSKEPADGPALLSLLTPPRLGGSEEAPPQPKPPIDAVATQLGPPGRYQLLGEIGRGGIGAIFRGRDLVLGRDLAIKVLLEEYQDDPDMVRRFIAEAQIGGQLQHPGIVPVHEIGGVAGRRPYFTMKLIQGQTLAALLLARTTPSQDRPRFLTIMQQVCQTLAYAHARGVIHRDLKPANIMVGAFGEVQVMDWGLAKVLADGRAAAGPARPTGDKESAIQTVRTDTPGAVSQAGAVMGTMAYMAPEQARGEAEGLDERCDVFGLGAILCEILTGQPPYVAQTADERYSQAVRGELTNAIARLETCGTDNELLSLAQACLAKEPADRPRNAGVVAGAMTAYLASVEQRLREVERARAAEQARTAEAVRKAQAERRARRLTLAFAVVVLALVLGGGGSIWWLRQKQSEAEKEVALAWREASSLFEQARKGSVHDQTTWSAALQAVKLADGLLATSGLVSTALRDRIRALKDSIEQAFGAAERHRDILVRLVNIRFRAPDEFEPLPTRPEFPVDTDAHYVRAFRDFGIDVTSLAPAEAAALIRGRPREVQVELLAALDDWTLRRRPSQRPGTSWQRLRDIAQQADTEALPNQLRGLLGANERETVRRLADHRAIARLPAPSLQLLAQLLRDAGEKKLARAVLQTAVAQRPDDVWLIYTLALSLHHDEPQQLNEAIRYYTAARAVRPELAHALGHALEERGDYAEALAVFRDLTQRQPANVQHQNCLGLALLHNGDRRGAIAAYRKAIELKPDFGQAYYNLGTSLWHDGDLPGASAALQEGHRLKPDDVWMLTHWGLVLLDQGDLPKARAALAQVIELKPDLPEGHNNFGEVLQEEGDVPGAMAAYQEAIRLKPDYAEAYCNLGEVLQKLADRAGARSACQRALQLKPDLAEAHANLAWTFYGEDWLAAIDAYRQAVQLKPDFAEAYFQLGGALQRVGRLTEALAAVRRSHELGSKRLRWLLPSAERLRKLEEQVEVERQLPEIVLGRIRPATVTQRLRFAEVCKHKQLCVAAARFYAEAFAAEPAVAEQLSEEHRYLAACAAALAGCGQSADASALDSQERQHWRRKALNWLHVDLELRAKQGGVKTLPVHRIPVRQGLESWKYDPDLAGLRDKAALALLPASERETCDKLWARVDELLREARANE